MTKRDCEMQNRSPKYYLVRLYSSVKICRFPSKFRLSTQQYTEYCSHRFGRQKDRKREGADADHCRSAGSGISSWMLECSTAVERTCSHAKCLSRMSSARHLEDLGKNSNIGTFAMRCNLTFSLTIFLTPSATFALAYGVSNACCFKDSVLLAEDKISQRLHPFLEIQ